MAEGPRRALMVIELDPDHIQESTARVQQYLSGLSDGDNQQYLAIHLAIDDCADVVMELFANWRREAHSAMSSSKPPRTDTCPCIKQTARP